MRTSSEQAPSEKAIQLRSIRRPKAGIVPSGQRLAALSCDQPGERAASCHVVGGTKGGPPNWHSCVFHQMAMEEQNKDAVAGQRRRHDPITRSESDNSRDDEHA